MYFPIATGESSAAANQPSSPSSLDPKIQMDLEYVLENNLKKTITAYASYVDCIRATVKEKGVSPEDFRSFVQSLPASTDSSKHQKLTLLSDIELELEKCNTITAIFDILKKRCASFLNYDIFQNIADHYNIYEDEEKMKYPEKLKAYVEKHKISEFTKINPQLKDRKGSKELTLKYDIKTTCRLAKVCELEKVIAKVLELHPSALHIVDIEEGCVIVTFLIPASVADALFTPDTVFTPQQEEELRAASVLWLKCNGYTFYFGKTIAYTESPGNPT